MAVAKAAVVGVDIGAADTIVAYVAKGAVDIVQNEVSQRKTPSLVAYKDNTRLLGDPALATIKSNLKNTCRQFQTIIGLQMDDPIVKEEQVWQLAPIVEVTSSLINSGFSDGVISLNPSLSVFARECIPSIQCLDRMKQGKKEKSGTTLHEAKY